MSADRTGTVFDIGYQGYTGEREGLKRARTAVFKDGVRTALGFGRGGRAKTLPWLFIGLLCFIALIMALVAGTVDRLGGKGSAAEAGLPSYADYYGVASIILFIFASVIGPELLCPDRRNGTINLYLVRPLSGGDYVVMRWASFLAVTIGVAWLPQFILMLGLTMGDPQPLVYLKEHWLDLPRFLAAGIVMSVYITTIALFTASFTTRRAYAAVFLVGLFAVSSPFTAGLARQLGDTVGPWISMFNLTNIPVHVNDIIFDKVSQVTRGAPAGKLPAWVRVLWYVGWTVLPGTALWYRYRRLTP